MFSEGTTQHAYIDAPLVDRQTWKEKSKEEITRNGKFPLLIFSHGLSACRNFYSNFYTELASEGFVVAAIEHRFVMLYFKNTVFFFK